MQLKDFEELIDIVISGGIELDKVITDVYKVDDVKKAFADFDENTGSMLKVTLEF